MLRRTMPIGVPPQHPSAMVNVLWGFNAAIAYLLLAGVGTFELRKTMHVLVSGLGALLM